jgi:hypothetical protein
MRVLLIAVLCGLASAQNQVSLESVKKIHIESLGDDGAASALRTGISNELAKSGRFELVDEAAQADAVLSGEGHMTGTKAHTGGAKAKGHYQATAAVQLKGKDQTVLWSNEDSYEATTNKASVMLGHQVGRKLLKAAAPAGK